jgi:hypothetical protein
MTQHANSKRSLGMRFTKNALQHTQKRPLRGSGTKSAATAFRRVATTLLFIMTFISFLCFSYFLSFTITSKILDQSGYDLKNWYDEVEVDPEKWESFGLIEMQRHFECHKAFTSTRPWWTKDKWREVRDFYRDFAQVNRPFRKGNESTGTYQHGKDTLFDSSQNAVPYQHGGEKGRGLKAARDIREGEIILQATNNTVVFLDGHTFRKFLFALNERFPTFACDVMMWFWIQDLDDEGEMFGVVGDLNDNNLLNTADHDEDVNVRCGTPGEEDSCDVTSINVTFYAERDIRKGEELLGSYGDFVSYYHSWEDLGLE